MKRFSLKRVAFSLFTLSLLLVFVSSLLSQPKEVNPISWYPLPLVHGREIILFKVVIARDEEARRRGLSLFSSLERGQGMLFSFPNEGIHQFWMRGMHFPIDILWFTSKGELCSIKEWAKPEDYPRTYTPECNARYVLEIPAGSVKAFHLEKGDTVDLSHIPNDMLDAE